jgi:hypothetical protein
MANADMLAMLADRNSALHAIAIANEDKRQVEEHIVKRLLRDNDHRYFNIAWRRLERDVIGR